MGLFHSHHQQGKEESQHGSSTMLEMGNWGQSCRIKPPNQCHPLWPQDLESLMSYSLFGSPGSVPCLSSSQKTHSLCFPPEVFHFMLLIHQGYPCQWSERWLQPDSNLCGLSNKSCCVGCSLFSGVDIQKDLAPWEKETLSRSPGGYTVLLLHLVIKKALSHHQV